MALVTVSEAARHLGVSTRQVNNLVRSGAIKQPARGVIDDISLERVKALQPNGHGRAWEGPTAWAAVELLNGGDAQWLGPTQRSRLRSRLRSLSAEQLVGRARNRAVATTYRAHPSALASLRDRIVIASTPDDGFGLAGTSAVGGYIAAGSLDATVHHFGLIPDESGTVTLRATSMPIDAVSSIASSGFTLDALDLATSLDTRERAAGLAALTRVLETFRDLPPNH